MGSPAEFAIRVRELTVSLADRTILKNLSLDVRRGEILGVVGASGGGKSVLMRTIIGLIPRQGGSIEVTGRPIGGRTEGAAMTWGILFAAGRTFLLADGPAEHPVSPS